MSATYLFTGGGTGGHLYPGIAVARKLQEKDLSAKIIFIGSKRGIESKILPKEVYPFHLLNIGPLNSVSKAQLFLTLLFLPWTVLQSLFLLLKYKPKSVIGFGGYASGPLLLACRLLSQDFYIWEGNAHPGLVTRKLANFAKICFLAFESKNFKYKNAMLCGVPTRFEADSYSPKVRTLKLNVFVFGGSQGARAINQLVFELLKDSANNKIFDQFNFVHQVGALGAAYKLNTNLNEASYRCLEFVHDMSSMYQWAHIVVCRGGASTLSEITQMGLPAIIIPLPTAADNHQFENAKVLEREDAAFVLEQKDSSPEALLKLLGKISQESVLQTMTEKSLKLAQKGAADKIADSLMLE